jgi:glycosyltransferase involved in cell wall biosynthesis
MLKSLFSKPYSQLYIVGDNAKWVIDEETKALKKSAQALGIKCEVIKRARLNLPQVVHYTSQFSLNEQSIYKSRHRISVDYFHGKPEQGENFKKCFESLKTHHQEIARVRVSTSEMEDLVKSSGIDPAKVMRIPIGVDTEILVPTNETKKKASRTKLGIRKEAMVIGSFQKDGVGWGEGLEPKHIKGPDIFLQVIEKLKLQIPDLHVLLSGPARGFVKAGLDKLGIPYTHHYFKNYSEISELYDALDLYLITSREEGGPKAVLEAMAKGIPLVTTAVGQAKDLVKHGQNAMMASIDDVEGLSALSSQILKNKSLQAPLIQTGFKTAQDNSYQAQLPLWQKYFENLITL